ncbi:MAG: hypothetical protein FWF54_01600 [Candidatus Azobacteroides sp.]|nr:hypothetical protein [Candidatus Azobacteroides sp.]
MITEGAIKQKFIIDKLKNAAESAFRFQKNVFQTRLKSRSGNTIAALNSPDYVIAVSNEHFNVVSKITKQLRLQDLGVRKIYTKPLFGALKHAYGQLQYGLQNEIKEKIREELENAVNQQDNG